MGITVEQALKIGGLVHGRVLAGKDHLDNVIEYVNIVEAPCEPEWEAQHHLFLTTFYAVKDNVEEQIRTIEILVANECAGLVFQSGVLPYLDERVIQAAEELGLPLIEIPEEITYPEVITPLVGAILREKTFLLQRAQDIHQRLIGLILEGRGLTSVATALRDLIHRPVAITDAWGTLLAASGFLDEVISSEVAAQLTHLAFQERLVSPVRLEKDHLWLQPLLSAHDTIEGFVLVYDFSGALDALDWAAIEQTAVIATLDLVKQKAILETERRLKRDFIEDMLGGEYKSTAAILSRARSLGWDLQQKRVVMLVDLDRFEDYYLHHLKRGEDHFQRVKNHVMHIVMDAVRQQQPDSIVVDRSDSVIVLPHFPKERTAAQARRDVQALAEAIRARAERVLQGITLSIAIGGFYDTIEGLRRSYQEAKAALRVGHRMEQQHTIIWYDHISLYVLLDQFATHEHVREWFQQTLGPLVAYDRQNNSELVKTLETFFDARQSIQQAAQQLFIHPKTLRYRLRRIQEILGTDPFEGEKQLQYYLATKLAKLLWPRDHLSPGDKPPS